LWNQCLSIGSTTIEEQIQVKNLVLSGMFLMLTTAIVGCGGEGAAPAPAPAPSASAPAVPGDAPGAPGAPSAAPAEKPAEKK